MKMLVKHFSKVIHSFEHISNRFLSGGYYSILSPTNLRFIALNTAMFQPHLLGFFDSREASEQIEYVLSKIFFSNIFELIF